MDRSSSRATPAQLADQVSAFLPQYGFGKTYKFDDLVDQHPFLYRVHTPHRHRATSRATSPNPSRPTSPFKPQLSRAPSLSASVSSIRSGNAGAPSSILNEEDDSAPGDPYFISRRFRDDLSSPDAHVRRRTLSTLSSLSGGSDVGTYIGSDYEYDFSDAESDVATAVSSSGLSRSPSLALGGRRRMNSLTPSRPGSRRSTSLGHVSFSLDGKTTAPRPMTPMSIASESVDPLAQPVDMTYADLQRHLDWTTRSQSPYVTTSFSFFWALWEAVRRYRLGVKHDVEIAVVDARRLRGRARTALEVLRTVEEAQQDKTYWKWYRFALDAQDVLVFGAIPGDAIYASTPLTQILANLPAYCFRSTTELTKSLGLAGDEDDIKGDIDPRSPTAHQVQTIFFPVTPDRKSLSGSVISNTPSREKERERARASELIVSLAWDVGTTLKPLRKHASKSLSSSTSSAQSSAGANGQRFTSHRAFCHALESAFLSPSRSEQARISDATSGAVRLASLLILPWLRATCSEGVGLFGDYESEDDDDNNSSSEEDVPSHVHGSECLGLAGDGCALESMHSSISSSASGKLEKRIRPLSRRALAMRDAEEILDELAAALARWPSGWWAADAGTAAEVERLRAESVRMCVEETASSAKARAGWALAGELGKIVRDSSALASAAANDIGGGGVNSEEDRRGRGTSRSRERSRSRIGNFETRERDASGGDAVHSSSMSGEERRDRAMKPWPLRRASSSSPSPYKPRARSPLGLAPAVLGSAIVLKDGKHTDAQSYRRLGKTASEPGEMMDTTRKGEWESSEEDLLSSSFTGRMARLGVPSTPGSPGTTGTFGPVRRDAEEGKGNESEGKDGKGEMIGGLGREATASSWELNTPPPTPPPRSYTSVGVEADADADAANVLTNIDGNGESAATGSSNNQKRTPPPPPPRSTRRPASPGTPGSLPGEWPGEGVNIGEVQMQVQIQPQTPQRPRPFSWSEAMSSTSTSTPPSGGVSRTSSNESLRNGSMRNDARAVLLGEVLQAALGLGTSIDAEGMRPRTPGSGSGSGSESPGRPMHHRRHSSQMALQLEQELSPVREEGEYEGEAALEAALEKLQQKQQGGGDGGDEGVKRTDEDEDKGRDADVDVDANGDKNEKENNGNGDESILASVSSISAPPVRERSSTLESIQEEEWSIIDVPADYAPTLEGANVDGDGKEYEREVDDTRKKESEELDDEIMRAQASSVPIPSSSSSNPSSLVVARASSSTMLEKTLASEDDQEEKEDNRPLIYTEKSVVLTPLSSPRALATTIPLPSSIIPTSTSTSTPSPVPNQISLWKRPFIRLLRLLGFGYDVDHSTDTNRAETSSPVFEDPCARADVVFEKYARTDSKSWAMSCFVVGVMASLLVSSAQRREIMFYNALT